MSKGSLKLVFFFLIIAMEAFHGLSFSKIPMENGGMVDSSQCFTDKDCVPYVPFMKCGGTGVFCRDGACACKHKSLSFSKIPMEKGEMVDSSQCFTDKDCVPFVPFMKCGGAGVFCRDGACACKKTSLSFSKIPMEKGEMVDSSQCFTDKDCVPFVPFMKCGGAGVFCRDGACACKKASLSFSKIPMEKGGMVDSSQCFTDKDCVPFIPFMKCGAGVFCRDGACACKQTSLSFSKMPMEKGGMVDSSQCFTDKECAPFVSFMKCGGAVAFCKDGACVCKQANM